MTLTRRELLLAGSGAVLFHSRRAQAQDTTGKVRLMQGPMVGAVDADRIRVWVRSSQEADLTLQVSSTPGFETVIAAANERARTTRDHTAVLSLGNLAPQTAYYYRVLINGALDPYTGTLGPLRTHTAPPSGAMQSFAVAFGSCARYALDSEQPIWNAVLARMPELFLWLGDNVYGDSLNAAALVEEYRRQRDVQSFRAIGHSIPQLAIWDDHDYGLNNQDRTSPLRDVALATFKNYWANPAYGNSAAPGVFFKYAYGAVDFFMLDSRYYRDPNDAPDVPGKTLLGREQREWLMHELSASKAIFKVLACGSGWSRAKGPGGDSWAAFLRERDALFEFIRINNVSGVLLLSGDTHVGELNAIPWSARGGYDLYDFVSSPLAQPCDDDWLTRSPEVRIRAVHAKSANFGLLRFDLDGEPRLSYELVDPSGRSLWTPLRLAASDLRNGVTSWKDKIDSHPA